MVLIISIELQVTQVQDDCHQLPDALDSRVRKIESSERIHHNAVFRGLENKSKVIKKTLSA